MSSTIFSSCSSSSSFPSPLFSLTNNKSVSNCSLAVSRSSNETAYMSLIKKATLSIKIVSLAHTTLMLTFVDSYILLLYVYCCMMWFNSVALPLYAMSVIKSWTDVLTLCNTDNVAFSASSCFKPCDIFSVISSCLCSCALYTTRARRTVTIPNRSSVYKSADLHFLLPFYDMPNTASLLIILLLYSLSCSLWLNITSQNLKHAPSIASCSSFLLFPCFSPYPSSTSISSLVTVWSSDRHPCCQSVKVYFSQFSFATICQMYYKIFSYTSVYFLIDLSF